jgi:beta-lactamase regulating signal transducer with metallopeptidase domain
MPDALLSIFVGVWLAMALALLVRVVGGVHAVFQLRDQCRDFPLDEESQLPLWLEARARRGARPTRLMLCDAVRGATVLGFQRPCIAVPPSLLKALTGDELDQVVLHEYAHVQRWDDWTRLAQAVIQAALWIHPAAAIVGRRLDLEREIACDEWVVSRTGLPKLYARCLTRAAEVRGRIGLQPLLGPALFARKRHLVLRVERLLAVKGRTRRHVSVIGAFVGMCVLAMVTLQLHAIPLVREIVEMPALALQAEGPKSVTSYPVVSGFSRTNPVPIGPVSVRAANDPDITLPNGRTPEPPNPRTYEPPNPRTHEPTSLRTDELSNRSPEVPARSFVGRYEGTQQSITPQDPSPWKVPVAIGVEIGETARTGSVTIANTFARAGMSLARRF